ncbi:MAG: organic solvent transporter ATP-binding protein [Myxococcales bacterium]|nr:organic solvent transporter ATP-binding protein [Myxococcales bacterium]
MISFRKLEKAFGDKPVLRGVDLEVRRGEVLFIIGTSGVGKSVTIKHLVGLLRPDAGEIWLDGRRVDQLDERALQEVRKRCAMVFQHATLFDSMTLLENVALPLRKHGRLPERAAEKEAMLFLDKVHLREFAHAYPAELGDGTRKRAAIARALTLAPECVLFDEPTTGLDPVSARRIDKLIRELSDTLGVTSVVVSHDLTSIFGIADRIALLYQGVAHAVGTPAEIRASTDPIVQQFIQGRSDGPMETPGF